MNHVRLSVCPSVRVSVCPSVRLSVCRHLGALLCTDECSLIPRWILLSFGTCNKHILELCLGVLFLKSLKNWNFGDFLKNSDFGGLSVIIDGSLYGRVLDHPLFGFGVSVRPSVCLSVILFCTG